MTLLQEDDDELTGQTTMRNENEKKKKCFERGNKTLPFRSTSSWILLFSIFLFFPNVVVAQDSSFWTISSQGSSSSSSLSIPAPAPVSSARTASHLAPAPGQQQQQHQSQSFNSSLLSTPAPKPRLTYFKLPSFTIQTILETFHDIAITFPNNVNNANDDNNPLLKWNILVDFRNQLERIVIRHLQTSLSLAIGDELQPLSITLESHVLKSTSSNMMKGEEEEEENRHHWTFLVDLEFRRFTLFLPVNNLWSEHDLILLIQSALQGDGYWILLQTCFDTFQGKQQQAPAITTTRQDQQSTQDYDATLLLMLQDLQITFNEPRRRSPFGPTKTFIRPNNNNSTLSFNQNGTTTNKPLPRRATVLALLAMGSVILFGMVAILLWYMIVVKTRQQHELEQQQQRRRRKRRNSNKESASSTSSEASHDEDEEDVVDAIMREHHNPQEIQQMKRAAARKSGRIPLRKKMLSSSKQAKLSNSFLGSIQEEEDDDDDVIMNDDEDDEDEDEEQDDDDNDLVNINLNDQDNKDNNQDINKDNVKNNNVKNKNNNPVIVGLHNNLVSMLWKQHTNNSSSSSQQQQQTTNTMTSDSTSCDSCDLDETKSASSFSDDDDDDDVSDPRRQDDLDDFV